MKTLHCTLDKNLPWKTSIFHSVKSSSPLFLNTLISYLRNCFIVSKTMPASYVNREKTVPNCYSNKLAFTQNTAFLITKALFFSQSSVLAHLGLDDKHILSTLVTLPFVMFLPFHTSKTKKISGALLLCQKVTE